jgi:hypothetical protein
MSTAEFARKVIAMVQTEMPIRPAAIEFEIAYQAKVAVERIRFAIKQIDVQARDSAQLREVSLHLLDALDRLQSAEQHFQESWRTSATAAMQSKSETFDRR